MLRQGRPFREGIRENPTLYYGLVGASAVAFSGATDLIPELNRWLQIAACSLRLKKTDGIIGMSNGKIVHLSRERMESNFRFLVFHCPLKEDAMEVLISRLQSPC